MWERIATVVSVTVATGLLAGFVAMLVTGTLDRQWLKPSGLDPAPAPFTYGATP